MNFNLYISPIRKKGSFFSFVQSTILFPVFILAVFFLMGFLEQGLFLRPAGIFTAVTLLFLQIDLLFWLVFALIFSFHYGEFFFQPSAYPLWPEYLKHFWWAVVVGGGFAVLTLLRPYLISFPLMTLLKKTGLRSLPEREKQALNSGTVWIEREFFSGQPNFKTLFSQPFPSITPEEKSFLTNETARLCETTSEWEIMKNKDIPQETLKFIKDKKFLGMIIPKKYGGLEFSPTAHALTLQKISSLNIPAAIFTMVPNSLGPSRLINRFGTQKQKETWLPLLTEGKEIPCFGLTEPQAGSDAGSLVSEGTVFKGKDGELKIKINWNKRYVSLSAVATLWGIVFQLKDPDNLLGRGRKPGIACALIPEGTPGIKKGLYHDPMGLPFYNGPVEGANVIIPAEAALIGGLEKVGQGWEMLMECLTLGRGISLPSVCLGISQRAARVVSCYSKIREQFGVPIGQFEGVKEKLSRIAGLTYLTAATQKFTLSALSQGISAPLPSALTKYNVTERTREIVQDGMDLMGGAGLVLGPKNLMATAYTSLPLAITVEGANILTRSFIVFGQGFLRSHPLALKEISALEKNDLSSFDSALAKHFYSIICNIIRGITLSLSRGGLYMSLFHLGKGHHSIQKIAWSASLFSYLANLAFFGFGAKLKRKEKLSGRFADILSHQYIATALLWNWKANGRAKHSWPAVKWGLDYCFWQIQKALEGLLLNINKPLLFFPLNRLLYFLLRINSLGRPPSDKLSKQVAKDFLNDKQFREELIQGSLTPSDPKHPLHILERTCHLIEKAAPTAQKIKSAIRNKQLPRKHFSLLMDQALEKNIITGEEYKNLQAAEQARREAIRVDAFTRAEYLS